MKKILMIVFLFITIASPVCAESGKTDFNFGEVNEIINSIDFAQIEGFLSQNGAKMSFKELLNSFLKGENILQNLTKYAKDLFLYEIKNSASLLVKLAAAVMVFSFANTFCGGIFSNSAADTAFLVCYMICSFILASVFLETVSAAKEVIYKLNYFVGMSMPILMGFIAASGAAAEAACINPLVVIGIEVLSSVVNSFFIPLVFAICVLSLFSGCSKNINIGAFLKTAKSVLKWSMGLVFTLFTGTVSLYGNFSSSADALTMRAAKYAIGASVPVVGTLLCDNMSVFTYSCVVIKNAFGAASIFVIVFMLAVPVIKNAVIAICLNLTAALMSAVADEKITNLICDIASAVTYVLAIVCLVGAVFILSIAIIVNTSALPV